MKLTKPCGMVFRSGCAMVSAVKDLLKTEIRIVPNAILFIVRSAFPLVTNTFNPLKSHYPSFANSGKRNLGINFFSFLIYMNLNLLKYRICIIGWNLS